MHSLKFKVLLFFLLITCISFGQASYPEITEGDYLIKDFQFVTGETLPELKLHYTTLGEPKKDANGKTNNVVLIMHGTTGSANSLLTERFAGQLFNPGQLLDSNKYYIILTDAIGHGKSSKPSDGLRMDFPEYTYDDMVKATYQLLTEHLGINHMRLIMGTSMGGMQSWVWGYTYPDFMDALMPLASLPVEIAGRNRMMRKGMIESIKMDPEWNNGNYDDQPINGLKAFTAQLLLTAGNPIQRQEMAPTRVKADSLWTAMVDRISTRYDANDVIYQFEASRFYNPSPHLEKIKAPLFAINSADDFINPPELKLMEPNIAKIEKGRYILIPISAETRGHGTHSQPEIWGDYLKELLEITSKD